MIAQFIGAATKIRLSQRTIAGGLAAFCLFAGAFLVVAYFAYRYAILSPADAESARLAAMIFAPALVGLFVAASLTLGLTGMALARQGFAAPLRDLQTCLTVALREPVNASKLALPDKQGGEIGKVIRTANDLFAQITASHWEAFHSMQTMASHTSDAVIAYDVDGNLLYANRPCISLCGFKTFDELKESATLPLFEMTPETPPVALPDGLSHGSFSKEVVLIGNGDNRTTVLLSAARLPVSAQFPTRFYASITDISVLRSAQEMLEAQNMELSTANRAKSEFLANMSHELRTPLNAIIGFSEIMKKQAFGPLGSPHYLEYMEDIHNSGNHLVDIINDILDLSKIEAGCMELHETKLPVRTMINSCLRIMHERAASAEVKLVVRVPDDLPDLHADERLVKQMLINLLSNGVKFTPAGGTITVGAQYKSGAVLIGVADTGIGMSREDALLALEPFRQVDGSHTRQQEGTGLGLPLVKSYIELHGGGFRLDSGPGKGTLVTLTFPPERTLTPVTEKSVA
ncbi:MAG: PAS domain-containing sensor histidine kinase [Proteobacteria bacterium]|nr:PAS domain-containing sensor histidine kinase [Pseudomonadota bacterium]MDA1324124.1 PAS domain-containing sensor histidine kinase [Pseudomonadota bacterium]